ncbi:AI-2E family transporter [Haloterrigena sp. SYSU A558-1]|uniref:AI-2E family transporter n=1 Tax=Haloterrigena gelatinilytica TaxID=2741724 RepID=A0A8J8GQW2_9EURY|nr:AI-2E family transporter [Haloterrigena gelatinilytica]NUB92872.1 AI-2E family transporter [Haloterrigena gelatinilytica]NUC71216.1 AI-2E family transporter [Haloterrigena gelatinilytica]
MDLRTAFFALLLVVLGVLSALVIAPLLQYVLAAGLLAFVLRPAHERLEPKLGPRPSAILLTGVAVLAAVVPLLVISAVVLGTAVSFLDEFDEASVVESARGIAENDLGLEARQIDAIETAAHTEIESSLSSAVELALGELIRLVNASLEMAIGLAVCVFLLYYLLVDGDDLVAWLGDVVPLDPSVRDELFAEVRVVTWAVIYSHVLVAVVQGLLGGIGLAVVGVPNAAFWTVIMILLSFLPAIGVWLVWGPAAGYLATVGDPLAAVVLLVYGLTVLALIDNYLRAIFVDRGSGLHPAAVIVGVIGGIYLLGIMGLFLGPVLLAVFKAGVNVFTRVSAEDGDQWTAPEPNANPGSAASGAEKPLPESDGAD